MDSHKNSTLVFLFTTFPPEVSGSAQYNWERVQWFAKQGIYRVVVLAPDCQDKSTLPPVPLDLQENLIVETYPSAPWIAYNIHYVPTLPAIPQINQRLTYYKPDLIVVVDVERFFMFSTWQLPGKKYAKEHRIPYVTEYHTDYYNFSTTYPGWKWLRSILLNPIVGSLYRQYDATIAPSIAASQSLQSMNIPNVRVVPFYGIDVSAYSPSHRDRKCLEPWLSPQEQDHKIVFYLGRLSLEKRVDLLIEAFAKLKSKQGNCSLIVAGGGPVEAVSKLKRLAEPISNIHFTGFIHGETKANLLASCDVFCSPCPYEAFGRTSVEAMASGIPVVTVNSGAVAEYIIDGVNGYLVSPNDVEGLTNAMQRVLSGDNTEVIQRGLQDAKHFSLEEGCQNLEQCYQQLLSQSLNK